MLKVITNFKSLISVRQLEAIVRISESIAKSTLSPRVAGQHVDYAIRLFKNSTMNALTSCDSKLFFFCW